jgi:hypothetical protein
MTFVTLMTALHSMTFEPDSQPTTADHFPGHGIVVLLDLLLPASGSWCGYCERV